MVDTDATSRHPGATLSYLRKFPRSLQVWVISFTLQWVKMGNLGDCWFFCCYSAPLSISIIRRFKQQNPFNLRSLGVSQNHPFRYVICVSNEFYICIYINHHHRWQWDPYITSLQAWLISLRLVPQTVGGPRYTMATLSAPMPFERITSMVQKEVSKNPMARTLKSSDQ